MQHLGIREHDVGVLARPRAVVGVGVAVVGDRAQARARATSAATRSWSWASALVGKISSAVSRRSVDDRRRRSAPGSRATCPTRCRSRRRRSSRSRSASIAAAWWVYSRSMPRDSHACDHFLVQRLRSSANRARALGQDSSVDAGARAAPVRRRARRAWRRASIARLTVPTACATGVPRRLDAGQWAWSVRVVARSRRTSRGRRRPAEARAAADRDRDAAGRGRVQRRGDPAEPVEVAEADAVELRVPAEQRQRLELADGAACFALQLPQRRQDQQALVVRSADVARREVVAVAGEAQRLVAVHPLRRRARSTRTGVRVVHLDRDVDLDPADPVDEPLEAGEVDRHDVRHRHADEAADALRLPARAALRVRRR